MASYTCISCRVAFTDSEVQRAHYKTDWHRYNLKRKVADMPPVTAENFQERVLAQRAAADQHLSDAAATESCAVCNKTFSSANAYQNHLQSHKHQQAERQALLAAQRKVEKMNEKNLEKGLGEEKVDHDARNQALQQVLKEQQKPSQARRARAGTSEGDWRMEKPPRMMWLEEQARRRQTEDGTTAEEGKDPWWESPKRVFITVSVWIYFSPECFFFSQSFHKAFSFSPSVRLSVRALLLAGVWSRLALSQTQQHCLGRYLKGFL